MSSATAQAPAKNGRGTLYRGHGGMWSWVGHRVTGVVIWWRKRRARHWNGR